MNKMMASGAKPVEGVFVIAGVFMNAAHTSWKGKIEKRHGLNGVGFAQHSFHSASIK